MRRRVKRLLRLNGLLISYSATYKAGDVLPVPTGAIHWATKIGNSNGAELVMYVIEEEKLLILSEQIKKMSKQFN